MSDKLETLVAALLPKLVVRDARWGEDGTVSYLRCLACGVEHAVVLVGLAGLADAATTDTLAGVMAHAEDCLYVQIKAQLALQKRR